MKLVESVRGAYHLKKKDGEEALGQKILEKLLTTIAEGVIFYTVSQKGTPGAIKSNLAAEMKQFDSRVKLHDRVQLMVSNINGNKKKW